MEVSEKGRVSGVLGPNRSLSSLFPVAGVGMGAR